MAGINYGLLSVEALTALLALVVLVVGLLVPKQSRYGLGYLITFGLAGILAFTFTQYGINSSTLNKMFILDDFAVYFKQLFLVAAILVSMASVQYVKKMEYYYGEFYVLIVFATLGMMLMASAGDLITLYLALELMTITFYILTGFKKEDHKSAEAGVKYLILGAMSSGILLYGLSLVYGFTGTTIIADVATKIAGNGAEPAVVLGLVLLVAGFGFKISSVPFQMWSPDVYEGAPTPVTAFLAVGSKAAAFAAILRVFLVAFPDLAVHWKVLFAVLSALTIIIGNLVAIPQTNIKRMLAYSSIAQAGYIMTGLVAANELGAKGVAFYGMLYVFATIGAFTVVMNFYAKTGSDEIKDYAGLAQRSPLMAAVLTVCLLSMAGIPPLAGFAGKFYLFSAVVGQGYLWLAIIGLIMSMASVYYYLSVVKVMYMADPADNSAIPINAASKFTLIACLVITAYLGVRPAELAALANKAAAALFSLM
ncbi:proton-translocating NADH-quinone oxidoreductase, chain N [Thermincola ferriacetica]|uniref:NADH-quinone oxidoreductase subunit N n=2 Tax=Thermincola TaxID=278993 RepID=D5X8J7_THEPJ|nr:MULTISPECIES: NADH-quinone oxidoreductase subunit N [Thermincola]ADG82873.1 proton-translocating NADH-quinone oxidoreductase, chain N [Thermincola potens JR]KNZ69648.1 proton-translocating NADH-quinone oxidoreductase, chain N [Thermincola ferriacetica]